MITFEVLNINENKFLPRSDVAMTADGELLVKGNDMHRDFGYHYFKADKDKYVIMHQTGCFDDFGTKILEGHIVEIHNSMETKASYITPVYRSNGKALVNAHKAHIKIGHGQPRELIHFCKYGIGEDHLPYCSCKILGNVYHDLGLLDEDSQAAAMQMFNIKERCENVIEMPSEGSSSHQTTDADEGGILIQLKGYKKHHLLKNSSKHETFCGAVCSKESSTYLFDLNSKDGACEDCLAVVRTLTCKDCSYREGDTCDMMSATVHDDTSACYIYSGIEDKKSNKKEVDNCDGK